MNMAVNSKVIPARFSIDSHLTLNTRVGGVSTYSVKMLMPEQRERWLPDSWSCKRRLQLVVQYRDFPTPHLIGCRNFDDRYHHRSRSCQPSHVCIGPRTCIIWFPCPQPAVQLFTKPERNMPKDSRSQSWPSQTSEGSCRSSFFYHMFTGSLPTVTFWEELCKQDTYGDSFVKVFVRLNAT